MSFISPDTVDSSLDVKDKKELLARLVEMLHRSGRITDPSALLKSLLDREKIMTTGIGRGIAVPHAVSPEIEEEIIALGRIPQGADFDSLDQSPVYFVFLLLGPEKAGDNHLKTLARISRLIQHTNFIEAIKKAETTEEILKILAEEDGKHKG
ncbi:MAG: PTS sugar transporter subunit IIA [Gemmatimonadota bacterium]|nr:PTS sugar transporter subunit IIA [Gemmatimonadota bacterium]